MVFIFKKGFLFTPYKITVDDGNGDKNAVADWLVRASQPCV